MPAQADYDLLVVGGSFAGLHAAATAAARGLRVAVLEAKQRPDRASARRGSSSKKPPRNWTFPNT